MLAVVIVACEIGFWMLALLGLAVRYLLRMPRTSAALLVLTPVVDLVLLAAAALDLHGGASASPAHSIAAIYLGFSIAYGHKLVRWADRHFAHRFAGGSPPIRLYGADHSRECWRDVLRTGIACAVAAGILWALARVAAETAETAALDSTYRVLALVLGVELIWAISYSIWPRRRPVETTA